jgi:hypothetical protein
MPTSINGASGGGASAPAGTGVVTVSSGAFVDPVASAATTRATLDAQQDVFTTRGDLVRAGVSGVAERLPLGTATHVLTSDGTDAAWAAPAGGAPSGAAGGDLGGTYPNPTVVDLTIASEARGDLLRRGASAWQRVGVGTNGQVLTSDGTDPVWATPSALANPMTTAGDMIVGGGSGVPARLAAGSTAGYLLTSNGSGAAPSWQAAGGGPTGWLALYGGTAFYVGGELSTGWLAADYVTASAAAAVPAFGPGQSLVVCLYPNATPAGVEIIASHYSAGGSRGWYIAVGGNVSARRQVRLFLAGLNAAAEVALTGSDFTIGAAYVIAVCIKADKSVRYSVNGGAVQTLAALSGSYTAPTSSDTYDVGSTRAFSPTFYPLTSALLGEVRTYSTEISDADLVAACANVATGTIPDVATGTMSTRFLPSDFAGGLRVKAQTGVTWIVKGGASIRTV